MRTLFMGLVAIATTLIVSIPALAGNQEIAEQIAGNLRKAGQTGELRSYRIGVEFQDGTARLTGQVISQDQMRHALNIAQAVPGVNTIKNDLTLVAPPARDLSPVRPASAVQPANTYVSQPIPATLPVAHAPQRPIPVAYSQPTLAMAPNQPIPAYMPSAHVGGVAPARYDQPNMPRYAWPSNAAYPNYAALQTPTQYSATAWPYIGPFYPYPQVPLGWRKVTMKWHDGWWMLDFKAK